MQARLFQSSLTFKIVKRQSDQFEFTKNNKNQIDHARSWIVFFTMLYTTRLVSKSGRPRGFLTHFIYYIVYDICELFRNLRVPMCSMLSTLLVVIFILCLFITVVSSF